MLPIGAAIQPTPELWLDADTAIVPSIKINAEASSTFVTDVPPIFVTGIYNTLRGRLGILGYAGCNDAQRAGDAIFFGAGARYYLGEL